MVDAVISAFLQVLVQAIADFVKKELMRSNGLERERINLISNVQMIQAVLSGADNMMQLSDVQKSWFGELKDVSYDAVEVLDEYLYEDLRHQVIHLPRLRNSKPISHMSARRHIFTHDMTKKIADIVKNIDSLEKKRLAYQVEIHGQTGQNCDWNRRLRSSSLPPTPVHGRQNDREKIIQMLFRPVLNCNVQVLPILGEAYIGKTTVAQVVINDERVRRYFELRPWVHVSSEFNVERITADIIESIEEGSSFRSNNLDNLQRHLKNLLAGRRYLLVLDDYRRNSFPDWELLQRPFLSGAAGSKIIVTTSSRAVATSLGTSDYCYQLHGLPQEDCWSLFRQYAGIEFAASNFGDFLNNRFKDEVIRKCKGLPSVAVSLGHRLRQEKDRSKWEAIVREENWDSNSVDCMRSHGIDYAQLDSHLKPCFAYCSIFPQDFQFEEEWLIQHWMAQGFIQCRPDTNTDMMAIGKDYFKSFVEESFFQRVHVGHTREQDRYSMSQKMQELAFHVSAGGCYILDKPCSNPPNKVRHLTVQLDKLGNQNVFDAISQCASLHTLVVVGGLGNYQLSIPEDILETTLKRLRVLDVSNFGLSELPKSIGDLIHLRCLQLRGTKIRELPKSICYLYNLQTLGLRNCYHLEELPTDIKYLRKLRHIDLHLDNPESGSSCHICSLKHMPDGIGRLIDLQTLSRFVISKSKTITRHSNIHELSELNNLRGELVVSNPHLVKDAQEAEKADLASKRFLRKIELSWRGNSKQADQIAANLKPARTISELTISGYCGMACPIWLCSENYMMHDLVTVRLHDFKSCSVLPSLGLLPQLKNLYLTSWDQLIFINSSSYGYGHNVSFESLKKFHLEGMLSLQRWHWDDMCIFAPCLSELVVKNCPQLRQLPRCIQNLRELEDMEIVGCGQLAVLPHMDGLTSLQRLEISDCNSICSLPSTGLPRSLQVLSISNCHQLSQSCKNLRSTVSLVWIDGNRIN